MTIETLKAPIQTKSVLSRQQLATIKAHIKSFYTTRREQKSEHKKAQRAMCDETRYLDKSGMHQFHRCYNIAYSDEKRGAAVAAWSKVGQTHVATTNGRDHCRYVFAIYAAGRGRPSHDERYDFSNLSTDNLISYFERSLV